MSCGDHDHEHGADCGGMSQSKLESFLFSKYSTEGPVNQLT